MNSFSQIVSLLHKSTTGNHLLRGGGGGGGEGGGCGGGVGWQHISLLSVRDTFCHRLNTVFYQLNDLEEIYLQHKCTN